jgi:hypothetical protein
LDPWLGGIAACYARVLTADRKKSWKRASQLGIRAEWDAGESEPELSLLDFALKTADERDADESLWDFRVPSSKKNLIADVHQQHGTHR